MEAAATETLAGLSVTTVRSIRQPVASLSGGQRQAVAIARAVLWNSKLVIMDEPTAASGGPDRDGARPRPGPRRPGLGGAPRLHNLNDVFEVADRIAVLQLGRMVASGEMGEFDPQSVVDHMTFGRVPEQRGLTVTRLQSRSQRRDEQAARRLDEDDHNDEARLDESAAAIQAPPAVAAGSLGGYLRAWVARLRAGESGVLPVVVGMFVISVIFQTLNGKFLTAGNLVDLLVQGAVFMMLAMAEVFPLLLGEIDLSAGFVAGVSGVVAAELLTTGAAGRGGRRSSPRSWSARRSGCSTGPWSPGSACRRSSSRSADCSVGRA